ncbi:MAG: class I SAM-dependent methyltransferase [Alphaproteobacteria bacterium]|nr:class I SAM-dependent methyltransferase [Alphaproteobacteria bacterium]
MSCSEVSPCSTPDPRRRARGPLRLAPEAVSAAVLLAAEHLVPHLEQGRPVDAATLRAAMAVAFGASDAAGTWDWKTAYDACEVAMVLFLRKYGKALFRKAALPASRLSALTKVANLLPTHTRRSEEAQAFQQFSTPVPLSLAALTAASLTSTDRVLEPSAGTGLLAILAEIAGSALILNEIADTRADLLTSLFPASPVTRFDAAQIDDHLDRTAVPSVIIMNPPFSVMANVTVRMADAAYRHVASALARLADGGRLVAITGANFSPDARAWRDAFIRLQERGRVVFTAAVAGSVYAKHGTTIETRLTVIDKAPAEDAICFPDSPGLAPDVATLLAWIDKQIPARLPVSVPKTIADAPGAPRTVRGFSPGPRPQPLRAAWLQPKACPSTMRRSTGRRRKAVACRIRSTRPMRSSRSASPTLSRIPRSWCNRPRWRRSRRRSRATGRCSHAHRQRRRAVRRPA